MPRLKTHYEQVPLEAVRKSVEEAIQQEEATERAKKKKLEEDPLVEGSFDGRGGRA